MVANSKERGAMLPRAYDHPSMELAVVSEQPEIRRHILTLLSAHGWHVKSYESAAAVLQDPHTQIANLLLTSEALSDMSGQDLLTRLRDRGWAGKAILIRSGCHTPTGISSAEFAAEFDPATANHHLIDLVEYHRA
jgi:FixJ family two-component response regulator